MKAPLHYFTKHRICPVSLSPSVSNTKKASITALTLARMFNNGLNPDTTPPSLWFRHPLQNRVSRVRAFVPLPKLTEPLTIAVKGSVSSVLPSEALLSWFRRYSLWSFLFRIPAWCIYPSVCHSVNKASWVSDFNFSQFKFIRAETAVSPPLDLTWKEWLSKRSRRRWAQEQLSAPCDFCINIRG